MDISEDDIESTESQNRKIKVEKKIENSELTALTKKEENIFISTYEEYESEDSSIKYEDTSDSNENNDQNKIKIATENKEEEKISKENKIETNKELEGGKI